MRTLAVLAAALFGSSSARDAKPNVLFLFTDDQRFDTIAALGNPHIKTPHLDRLAQSGFVFTNAYCMGSTVGAVCLPSRTMLMTGRSLYRIPGRNAVAPALATSMKDAGYVTFRMGKRSNTPHFANEAFDQNVYEEARDAHATQRYADRAIEFLRGHKGDKPFYLHLSFSHPHDPRNAPPDYLAMYPPEKIPLPKNYLPEHPFDNGELKVRDEKLAPWPRTPEVVRRHLADYYATITFMDAQIGRILEALKDAGQAENTVILFSSDHGLAMGSHGLMGKQNLYEHNKPPLLLAGKGIPKGRSAALVYLYDLFPTICDFAGAKIPVAVEGLSLVPLIQGGKEKVRERLGGAYRDCQRMIRDDRWKLLWYPQIGKFQLFDLSQDPEEIKNLADDAAHAERLADLKKRLAEWQKEFDDPGPKIAGR